MMYLHWFLSSLANLMKLLYTLNHMDLTKNRWKEFVAIKRS